MRHGHFHQHRLDRQKYICPYAEQNICRQKECFHATPHLHHECEDDFDCPDCIKTQDVIDEETFTEKEFEI